MALNVDVGTYNLKAKVGEQLLVHSPAQTTYPASSLDKYNIHLSVRTKVTAVTSNSVTIQFDFLPLCSSNTYNMIGNIHFFSIDNDTKLDYCVSYRMAKNGAVIYTYTYTFTNVLNLTHDFVYKWTYYYQSATADSSSDIITYHLNFTPDLKPVYFNDTQVSNVYLNSTQVNDIYFNGTKIT